MNLAIAQIYRAREDNVQALNYLKRSYPDYSQMKPEDRKIRAWAIKAEGIRKESVTQVF